MSSLPVFSGVRVTRSLVLCVCFVDRCLSFCPFVLFCLVIVLSVLLLFTDSDYPFGIFKIFSYMLVHVTNQIIKTEYSCRLFPLFVLSCVCFTFDLHLEIDSKCRIRTKLNDITDDFNFPIVNFPFICNDIQAAFAYGL